MGADVNVVVGGVGGVGVYVDGCGRYGVVGVGVDDGKLVWLVFVSVLLVAVSLFVDGNVDGDGGIALASIFGRHHKLQVYGAWGRCMCVSVVCLCAWM